MWLTKNEKKVLKLLVDNAKLSDTSIANQLNISSQAIGKIRRKLEENVIKKYTVELDLEKLNLNLFLVGKASIISSEDISIEDVEKRLIEISHNLCIFKLFTGTRNEYIFVSLYKDLNNLKDFMDNECKTQKVAPTIKINEMYEIPIRNVLKSCSYQDIFKESIDDLGTKLTKFGFEGGKKII